MKPQSRPPVYVALMHYPMKNRQGDTIATSVTNIDLHDIARTCRTYGVKKYFVVTPVLDQHRVVTRILSHWQAPSNQTYHPDRASALNRICLKMDFEGVLNEIVEESGDRPMVVMPDASPLPNAQSYLGFRKEFEDPSWTKPIVLVFGTGWGLAPTFFPVVDRFLVPIDGFLGDPEGSYNHLSVRAAVAILLDRLLG